MQEVPWYRGQIEGIQAYMEVSEDLTLREKACLDKYILHIRELCDEIDRLRACAAVAETKTCRMEFDGENLIVTAPFGYETTEREIGQFFAEIHLALTQTLQAVAEEKP